MYLYYNLKLKKILLFRNRQEAVAFIIEIVKDDSSFGLHTTLGKKFEEIGYKLKGLIDDNDVYEQVKLFVDAIGEDHKKFNIFYYDFLDELSEIFGRYKEGDIDIFEDGLMIEAEELFEEMKTAFNEYELIPREPREVFKEEFPELTKIILSNDMDGHYNWLSHLVSKTQCRLLDGKIIQKKMKKISKLTEWEKYENDWFCTDPDASQYCRKLSESKFEFAELKKGPVTLAWNEFCTDLDEHDFAQNYYKTHEKNWQQEIIDLEDYTEDDIQKECSSFYTKSQIKELDNQLKAECIFKNGLELF